MAKAIIEYDLTDPDDQMEHLRATRSTDMALVLWNILHNTRRGIQERIDNESLTDPDSVLDAVYERIYEHCYDRHIQIDGLIQ